jgi:hypothetical protein
MTEANQKHWFRDSESLQTSLALLLVVVIFSTCLGAPVLLHSYFGDWLGLLGSVIGIVCWIYLIRPMPGLGAGIIALSGLFALLGALVIWIVRVIQHVVT